MMADQSSPWTGRFSPMAPGTIACPSARKLVDRLYGVEAHRTLRSSVVAPVAVCVALEPQRGDPCRRTAVFGTPAGETLICTIRSVHPRPPWRASARGPSIVRERRYERPGARSFIPAGAPTRLRSALQMQEFRELAMAPARSWAKELCPASQ